MKVLVTGGGGFLGLAVVKQLLKAGYKVVSYSRAHYHSLEQLGVVHHQGSLLDYDKLRSALQGCEAVFHVAGKTGIWGTYASYYATNVTGTKNIITLCGELGIRYLIYTSSASVVYGACSASNNESLPYSTTFDAYYPQTKAMAEKAVLRANGLRLATCALRPHLIWGPEDPHLLPRFLARQQKGQFRLPGKGEYLIDTTYVDNAALAHLQAFEALQKKASVSGKAYFISQDKPISIRAFVNLLLNAGGLQPVKKTIHPQLAIMIGWLLQRIFRTFRLQSEPPLTLFVARQFASSHWYDISAAKRDFGYQPVVSTEEGMRRTKAWFQANKLLGG